MDIDQYGNPWIVSESYKLYALIGGKLTHIPGQVRKIAIQKNSTKAAVFALGKEKVSASGYAIYKLNNSSFTWERLPGEAE